MTTTWWRALTRRPTGGYFYDMWATGNWSDAGFNHMRGFCHDFDRICWRNDRRLLRIEAQRQAREDAERRRRAEQEAEFERNAAEAARR
eukprot:11516613-Alexandrium_andersonii.AAC.1